MNSFVRILIFATLTIANGLLELRGAEIETTVVDALGTPLPGASVELRLTSKGVDGKRTNGYLTLTTDRGGRAKGSYDEKVSTVHEVSISLSGYSGFTMMSVLSKYELKKQFTARDVRRAARLKGERQRAELRALLAGDYELNSAYERLDDMFLVYYQDLRSSLLDLLSDPQVGPHAAERLMLIGNPDDLTVVAKKVPQVANRDIYQIKIAPKPRPNTNLVEAALAVAKALEASAGKWTTNQIPRLNDDETMALVDCYFVSERCELTYTATFHNLGGLWTLRGVRAGFQSLMAAPPKRSAYVGVWHGSSDLLFARLQLNDNGTGAFAISYNPASSPQNYRITRWSLDGYKLKTSVEPADPDAEPITLQYVRDGIDALCFKIVGRGGWSREMTLLNALQFERRAKAAKQKLDKLTPAHE